MAGVRRWMSDVREQTSTDKGFQRKNIPILVTTLASGILESKIVVHVYVFLLI